MKTVRTEMFDVILVRDAIAPVVLSRQIVAFAKHFVHGSAAWVPLKIEDLAELLIVQFANRSINQKLGSPFQH